MNSHLSPWWTALWDSGVLAMGVLSPARTYIQVNTALCHLLQTDVGALLAWPYEKVSHPLDLDAELDAFVRLAEGATSAVYFRRFRTARDEEVSAEVRLCAGPDGHVLQIVCPGQAKVVAGAEQLGQRLEQLASALSHDALELVRQIGVQAGMLGERYGSVLDERGQKTIATI